MYENSVLVNNVCFQCNNVDITENLISTNDNNCN